MDRKYGFDNDGQTDRWTDCKGTDWDRQRTDGYTNTQFNW